MTYIHQYSSLSKQITSKIRVQNQFTFLHGAQKTVTLKTVTPKVEVSNHFSLADEQIVKDIISDKNGEYDSILDQVKGQIPNFTGVCSWGL